MKLCPKCRELVESVGHPWCPQPHGTYPVRQLVPEATGEDRHIGWKIDLAFLKKVCDDVEHHTEERPSLEATEDLIVALARMGAVKIIFAAPTAGASPSPSAPPTDGLPSAETEPTRSP